MAQVCYVPDTLPVTQPTVSKHCRKLEALIPASEHYLLASSFLHPPPYSRNTASFMPAIQHQYPMTYISTTENIRST